MSPVTERRGHPRVAADFPVQLAVGGDTTAAQLRDISASGLLCETDRRVPVMTQVRLVLSITRPALDPREVMLDGAVVRCREVDAAPERYETAIFFTNMDEDTRELFAGLGR